MKNFNAICSGIILALCVVSGVLGNPTSAQASSENASSSRAFTDLLISGNAGANLTKSIIDSTLSVLGVFAFTIAFVVIPVLALLYSGSSWGINRASRSMLKGQNKNSHVRLARSILDSDRCIERIVCEVSHKARNSRADKWADMIFNNVPIEGKFMRRVSDVYRAQTGNCGQFTCEPVGFVVRLFIYATDWNTVLKG